MNLFSRKPSHGITDDIGEAGGASDPAPEPPAAPIQEPDFTPAVPVDYSALAAQFGGAPSADLGETPEPPVSPFALTFGQDAPTSPEAAPAFGAPAPAFGAPQPSAPSWASAPAATAEPADEPVAPSWTAAAVAEPVSEPAQTFEEAAGWKPAEWEPSAFTSSAPEAAPVVAVEALVAVLPAAVLETPAPAVFEPVAVTSDETLAPTYVPADAAVALDAPSTVDRDAIADTYGRQLVGPEEFGRIRDSNDPADVAHVAEWRAVADQLYGGTVTEASANYEAPAFTAPAIPAEEPTLSLVDESGDAELFAYQPKHTGRDDLIDTIATAFGAPADATEHPDELGYAADAILAAGYEQRNTVIAEVADLISTQAFAAAAAGRDDEEGLLHALEIVRALLS